jgi:hypothetical protein
MLERSSVRETIGTTGTAETFGTGSSQLNGWNHWNRLLLGVLKAIAGLDPSNGTVFPTIPDDSTGFEAS